MTTSTSGTLGSYVYSYKPQPTLAIYEWDIAEATSPNGYRAVVSGVPTFIKQLGTSSATAMQFEDAVLDFSSLQAEYATKVQCFTFINTTGTFFLSNMRLWMPSGTALDSGGHMEFAASGTWHYNAVLPSGAGTAVPTSLPAAQNVFRQDADPTLWLVTDTHASQYVYLGLTIPSGYGFGRYGVDGTGNLVFRITYDWYSSLIPSYLTPENYPQYPRNWSYPYEFPDGATSGWHLNEDNVWMRAPTAKTGELLLAFAALGNYNATFASVPSEWTTILQGSSLPDIDAYYKTYDSADASGQLYQWACGFTNGFDYVGHVLRIVNGGTPINSGFQTSTGSTQEVLSNLTVAQKATVVYYFATRADNVLFAELPADVIIMESGIGDSTTYNTPNWAIGYKSFPQAGVDGGGTFAGQSEVSCLRVVVPYQA